MAPAPHPHHPQAKSHLPQDDGLGVLITGRVALERDTSRNPLYDAMFAFQDMPLPADDLPGVLVHQPEVDPGRSLFDLENWSPGPRTTWCAAG